ncbi:ATP-binding protein [Vicingaceae bacterium]|nr:ATP-binding protein [Vicingaceae bacterium]
MNGQTTELNQLRDQIKSLEKELCRAQQLTALGELVGTTTHEFNNVLMTIINYAKMGARYEDKPTRDKAFAKILAAGGRATKITNSVLGMARNRKDRMEPTDLRGIIDETMVLLEKELQKYRILAEMEIAETPCAMANANQIQQVFLNLLINARQAMNGGGRLIIRLEHDDKCNTVDLIVRDFGEGIPAEKLPKIFDRYFSTKSGPDETGKGGTGLGLAACRKIIEAHNGKIRVQSTVGKGTCFTVKLPVAKPADNKTAPNVNPPVQVGHTPPAPNVAASIQNAASQTIV